MVHLRPRFGVIRLRGGVEYVRSSRRQRSSLCHKRAPGEPLSLDPIDGCERGEFWHQVLNTWVLARIVP